MRRAVIRVVAGQKWKQLVYCVEAELLLPQGLFLAWERGAGLLAHAAASELLQNL